MPADPDRYCCIVCGQLMQKAAHWRNKAGDKITLLRCFNCFGDEVRLTTGPKPQLPMGPPLTPKPEKPIPLEKRLNQPYAIPDHIIKQQKARRLLATISERRRRIYADFIAVIKTEGPKSPKAQQALIRVLSELRLEYKGYL